MIVGGGGGEKGAGGGGQLLDININWTQSISRWRRKREREQKTLTLKDSSVRSIWTNLTASRCYTTKINKHDYTTNRYYKQPINAVAQSAYTTECAETSEIKS